MELRREQEANRSVATIAKATVTGFQAYLNKVDGMVTSVVKKVAGEEEEDGEPKKLRSSRCGGRGICELFGTWDGQRPHGLGKAKFLMVLYHNPLPPLPPSPSTSLFSTVAFVWLSLSLSVYISLSCLCLSCLCLIYIFLVCRIARCVFTVVQNLGYVSDADPVAGDMYDELLCNFDFGKIVGHVSRTQRPSLGACAFPP
jgi:hypothetical protein